MDQPANAAIRERRRRSTPFDIEQMNIMRAVTAAEYSRRQFVLNFAASKDPHLLVPGQKADAIKEAEGWAVRHLSQNGYGAVANELFKYTVDARLWSTLVGVDTEFPFAFMRHNTGAAPSIMTEIRPVSDIFPTGYEIGVAQLDKALTRESSSSELPPARRPSKIEQQQSSQHSAPAQPILSSRRRSTKKKQEGAEEKRRSLSLYGFEDLKMAKKLNQDRFPLLVRLGRSFSRRMSG
ncbi:hypothetical protein OQA88_3495 [Cercophora sp. LCS_1]